MGYWTKKQHLDSNVILFLDDMEASHHAFNVAVTRYNLEKGKYLKIEPYRSVADFVSKRKGPYVCGVFDWNLGSNDINERGDRAIEQSNGTCFHKCILTRMFDDSHIQGYCTKNGIWYIVKTGKQDVLYQKVRDYLDYVFHWLEK